ncbi:MAG: hypothetical protein AAF191_05515 [Verrucomicrobiota bacterium]
MAQFGAKVERRNPSEADRSDPAVALVDVGEEHDEGRSLFDHHQFPRDHPPICALSLVLQAQGLYEDAKLFCEWLEAAEWLDSRGPEESARWMGIERDVLGVLSSPIDISLLRWFARESVLEPGHPLWEVMKVIGDDLVSYVRSLRDRMAQLEHRVVFWTLDWRDHPNQVIFLPRESEPESEPAMGLERFVLQKGLQDDVIGMVYPDRRGSGYGLSRYRDRPVFDFTRLKQEGDVHFAHARGFVAKTSAREVPRLRELLELAASA